MRLEFLVRCFTSFLFFLILSIPANAKSREDSSILSPEEQSRLAERFAPILIFHPAENYFPSSPLFGLEAPRDLNLGSDPHSTRAISDLLGTPESRTAKYRELSIQEKARISTVYYRAYQLRRPTEDDVILEYWFYYVQDTYRARDGIFPIWFDGSHPNDLEHIQIVLHRLNKAESLNDYGIVEIHSSAHEGRIPANRCRCALDSASDRPHILVELGSHANASDKDGDGVFTPHVDGDSGYKIIWGIRDKGVSWIWHRDSYMTPRDSDALVFVPSGSVQSEAANSYSYRLIPAERLVLDVNMLGLSDKERKAAFQTEVSWFTRVMGRSNGNANALLSPPKPNLRSRSFDREEYSRTQRGLLVGVTNLMPKPGVFIGGRYSFMNSYRFLPDLRFEADGILNPSGKRYLSTDAMLTYPIDAITTFMFGTGVVTDSIRYKNYERDWIGAFEVRLGRLRLYAASRSWGPITKSAVDFRASFFF